MKLTPEDFAEELLIEEFEEVPLLDRRLFKNAEYEQLARTTESRAHYVVWSGLLLFLAFGALGGWFLIDGARTGRSVSYIGGVIHLLTGSLCAVAAAYLYGRLTTHIRSIRRLLRRRSSGSSSVGKAWGEQ
jgi:hypothetical protein